MNTRRLLMALSGATLVLAAGGSLLGAPPAHARDSLGVYASMNGRDLRSVDTNRPLHLRGHQPADIVIRVTNEGAGPVTVRGVRIEGQVLGLTFFSYETRVDMQMAPGAQEERHYTLDLVDLGHQADGLIPSRLVLLAPNRSVLASKTFPADIDGSRFSIYGIFGVVVAAVTALLLVGAIVRLAQGRLSVNRWKRAVRFGTPGLGVGLTLTFSLSTAHALTPSARGWAMLVAVCGAIFFGIGYLTPTPTRARGTRVTLESLRLSFSEPEAAPNEIDPVGSGPLSEAMVAAGPRRRSE